MKLAIEDLSKTYLVNPVLNINECCFGNFGLEGLIGPNGAGKSTLMGLLTRRIGASTGRVSLVEEDAKHDLMALHSYEVARLGVIKTNQRIQNFDSLTIRDSLRLAATSPERESLRDIFAPTLLEEEVESEVEAYLEEFSFSSPDGYALSGGEKKLLDILRCLAAKPRLLLMDEPTAGLPDDVTEQVMNHVRVKVEAKEMMAVIVEHDLDLIWNYCEYVHFLSEGELLFQGTPESVKKNRVVAEKYMGV